MLSSRAVISLTLSLSLSVSLILSLSLFLSLSHAHLFSFSTPVSFSSCPDRAEVQFYFPVNYSSVRLFIACLIDQISLQTFLFIIGVIIEQEVHDKQKLKFRHEYRTWRRRRRKTCWFFCLNLLQSYGPAYCGCTIASVSQSTCGLVVELPLVWLMSLVLISVEKYSWSVQAI